jgi:hypothetical protein
MDLIAYAGVIRRQWRIVIIGIAIAEALAFMAVVRVTSHGLEYRSPTVYAARTTLFVTEKGFPWGRSGLTERATGPDGTPIELTRFADPGRMEYLARLYAELARSRTVRTVIERDGKLPPNAYDVVPLKGPDGGALPLIEVVGKSASREEAISFSTRVAEGLRRFVTLNQNANNVPDSKRIALPVVTRATEAEVLQGLKLTRPILILLLGAIVTLVIAFTRDNLRRLQSTDSPETKVAKLDPAPQVAAVEEQVTPGPGWDRPQAADRSSG